MGRPSLAKNPRRIAAVKPLVSPRPEQPAGGWPLSILFGRAGRATPPASSGPAAVPRSGCSGACSPDRARRAGRRTGRSPRSLHVVHRLISVAAVLPPSSLPANNQFFRPRATGFIARSLAPLSISRKPASRWPDQGRPSDSTHSRSPRRSGSWAAPSAAPPPARRGSPPGSAATAATAAHIGARARPRRPTRGASSAPLRVLLDLVEPADPRQRRVRPRRVAGPAPRGTSAARASSTRPRRSCRRRTGRRTPNSASAWR